MELESLPITEIAKIVIPGMIAFVTGRYFAQRTKDATYSKEAFHELYDPLYLHIKPYLYMDLSAHPEFSIVLKQMTSITKSKHYLVHDELDHDLKVLTNCLSTGENQSLAHDKVCLSIERTHKKLKSNLGYPVNRRLSYHIGNSSNRRFKAKLKRIDLIIAELLIVVFGTFLVILLSKLGYDAFVKLYNWVINVINTLQ